MRITVLNFFFSDEKSKAKKKSQRGISPIEWDRKSEVVNKEHDGDERRDSLSKERRHDNGDNDWSSRDERDSDVKDADRS